MNEEEIVQRMELHAQFMTRVLDDDLPMMTVVLLQEILEPSVKVTNIERSIDVSSYSVDPSLFAGAHTLNVPGTTETVTCTWVRVLSRGNQGGGKSGHSNV